MKKRKHYNNLKKFKINIKQKNNHFQVLRQKFKMILNKFKQLYQNLEIKFMEWIQRLNLTN